MPGASKARIGGSLLAASLTALVVTGCTGPVGPTRDAESSSSTTVGPAEGSVSSGTQREAELVMQLTEPHAATGGTLLEGPVFDEDGRLIVVDVLAPAGEPKVMAVDLDTEEVETLVSDGDGFYTSAQISPFDGRLYLTDFAGSRIDSVELDGTDLRTFYEGPIGDQAFQPDDLAFDRDGHLYVSDFTAIPGATREQVDTGRVIRIDRDSAEAAVLLDRLPSPNGISFAEDYSALWLSQYGANRVDVAVLDESGTAVTTTYPGIFVDGGISQIDSNAVDADGNVYQGFHYQPAIHVYDRLGAVEAVYAVPDGEVAGPASATNIAIRPGTTDAVMVVSGVDGGYLYRFEAPGEGVRQTNGG